jgi:hypothetical protein
MGELVPFIAIIFVAMVIVGCTFGTKAMSKKQVVKPFDQADLVERDRYTLTNERATLLVTSLKDAIAEAKTTKKPVTVRMFLSQDRMWEITVSNN